MEDGRQCCWDGVSLDKWNGDSRLATILVYIFIFFKSIFGKVNMTASIQNDDVKLRIFIFLSILLTVRDSVRNHMNG